jgi:hypothetical protein
MISSHLHIEENVHMFHGCHNAHWGLGKTGGEYKCLLLMYNKLLTKYSAFAFYARDAFLKTSHN